MIAETICQLARRIMQHPAAPYHEHAVRDEVERICAEHGLPFERDQFGNVLVRWRTAARQRPLVLAAHLDHPGFEVIRGLSSNAWLARFRGGVADNYFRAGIPVRLMPGETPAKLGRHRGKARTFELQAKSQGREQSRSAGFQPAVSQCFQPADAPTDAARRPRQRSADWKSAIQQVGNLRYTEQAGLAPRFAVWELEDFSMRRGKIYGRACDDLIGVAAVLATILELKRKKSRVNVLGVISRAEEIGFHGALACAASGSLPKNSLVISLETSRELPGVKMGRGVILRVGDRTSIFDPEAMRFLSEIASGLTVKRKGFQFQRGLMSGGTCEGTAYQELGFQTAAVCVALGNYHNCAARNRIAAEYVSVADAFGMVQLLVAAAEQMRQYPQLTGKLGKRLNEMLREAQKKLRATAEV